MTGVTFPAFMSSHITVRSSLFGLAINGTSFWLTKGDNASAVMKRDKGPSHRPSGPAAMTQIPLGFKTRLNADNE